MRFTGSGAEGESGISRTSFGDMGRMGFLLKLGVEKESDGVILCTGMKSMKTECDEDRPRTRCAGR